MFLRIAAALTCILANFPAWAGEMKADEARHFVVGKMFSFTCFEGTRGAGRVYANGAVAGTVQFRGSGPARYMVMPPHTLQVKGQSVCAYVRGMPFQPCFNLDKTTETSFRGSVSGLWFAYCDFNRETHRPRIAHRHPHRPLKLRPAVLASDR